MMPALRIVASVALFCVFVAASGLMGALIAQSRNDTVAIECIGDKETSTRTVYLHGLDSFGPSWQELANRQVLARLASEHGLRIALPRGPMCGSGRCWPQQETSELAELQAVLRQSQASCFDGAAANGVIGFSNGGFAAAELFENCMLADLDWIITSGSGGFIEASKPQSLASCGDFILIVGDRDRYHRAIARSYHENLNAHGVNTKLIEFEGGHGLDYGALHDALLYANGAQ